MAMHHYQRTGAWAALRGIAIPGPSLVTWPVYDALVPTADTHTAIGFFRGDQLPTRDTPLTNVNCTTSNYGARQLRIPVEGNSRACGGSAEVARHLFNVGIDADTLATPTEPSSAPEFSLIT